MAEDTSTPEAGDGAAAEAMPPIIVNAQYTKDLSFEAPTAPAIYGAMQQSAPDVQISVNVDFSEFENEIFEVVLKVDARCTVGEEVAFLLELEYAGLFTLNVDDEVKGAALLIECPRLLFPFARNILADVSRDGGFPPLMLGPVDFAQLYHAELEKQGAEAADAAS
ncbi:MAG: protein-export chaperone SecB [Magnetovibrio sp.]|nr:protein-export chaperone SecB [Magnetovibrio sp.]